MDAAIKARWIANLKSKKYKQGKGGLCTRSGDGFAYCPLGVLCDIYMRSAHNRWNKHYWNAEDRPGNIVPFGCREDNLTFCSLPVDVLEWAGIDYGRQHLDDDDNRDKYLPRFSIAKLSKKTRSEIEKKIGTITNNSIVYLNDNGVSFAIIAKVIREALI